MHILIQREHGTFGMVSGEFIEVYAAVDQFRIRRLDKVTRGKIPLAENLLGILRDVLHDIVASGFVILINGNTGGIAILPVRHIVDRLAAIRGQGHTTARDVAIMSRELVQKYPDIYQYTGIWMEDITHTTARGSTPFTLSSTNKLLKQYQWATGLKTGSTAKAKYCLSATARKDGIDLITVVMTAPDSRARFLDAATLLSYGYSVSALYRDDNKDQLLPVPVKGGQEETVPVVYASEFVWLDTDGNDISMVQKRISVPKEAEAPVVVGTKAGEAIYRLNGEQIGTVPILYASNVEKAFYRDYVKKAVTAFLL